MISQENRIINCRGGLLVIGATGSIGRHVVDLAIRIGYLVRILIRDSQDAKNFPEIVEVIVADITEPQSLKSALDGVNFVIFTHGTYSDPVAAEHVDYGAVRNVLLALKENQVRLALMSTICVTDRKGSHDWKRRGERLVRASGFDYTIVRPGWFDLNSPNQNRLVMIQGDTKLSGTPRDGVVARRQVAEVLVQSLTSEAARRKTFELHAEVGRQQEDFEPYFNMLDTDASDEIDGRHDVFNMPLEQEPVKIRDDLVNVKTISETRCGMSFYNG